MKPSKAVLWFIEEYKPDGGKALDVGSGKGRNSIYLAQNGYEVTGIEIVEHAIEVAVQEAQKAEVSDKVNFIKTVSSDKLDFPGDNFDLVIDMMVMHLLDEDERKRYGKEVARVLKPGGYFMFYTIAAHSPAAMELFKTHPGPEPNSYVVPQSGMIEKAFTKDDITEMFSPLNITLLEEKPQFTKAFGETLDLVFYQGLLQKAT